MTAYIEVQELCLWIVTLGQNLFPHLDDGCLRLSGLLGRTGTNGDAGIRRGFRPSETLKE
jgi:hypothetical protein